MSNVNTEGHIATKTSNKMLCPICCDEIDNAKKIVQCHFCSYETCSDCAQQYLLGTIEIDAHCMNCRKGWTRDVLLDKFPKKFVTNDFKKHRENVLFDREKALLPATQVAAETRMKERKMMLAVDEFKKQKMDYEENFYRKNPAIKDHKAKLDSIRKEIIPFLPKYSFYTSDPLVFITQHSGANRCEYPCLGHIDSGRCRLCMSDVCDKCGVKYRFRAAAPPHVCLDENLEKEKKKQEIFKNYRQLVKDGDNIRYTFKTDQLRYELRNFDYEIRRKEREIRNDIRIERVITNDLQGRDGGLNGAGPSSQELTEKRSFVRACPVDGCRGFLSTAWKCGMCNTFACSQCHEVKGEKRDAPHTCKPENIETAKLLAKDTKPCPSCGVGIFKIDGCDQMWCIECHTAFSWKTGQIAKGNIHNPHYYEYMRKQGGQRREIRDLPCGGLPDFSTICSNIRKKVAPSAQSDIINNISLHFRTAGEVIDLRAWYRDRNLEDTREIRIKYLIKDYDDTAFKKMLQMKSKAKDKIHNIDQVLDMYVMACTTLLQSALHMTNEGDFCTLIVELNELRNYTNESLKHVGEIYDCKVPIIRDNGTLHKVGDRKAS